MIDYRLHEKHNDQFIELRKSINSILDNSEQCLKQLWDKEDDLKAANIKI